MISALAAGSVSGCLRLTAGEGTGNGSTTTAGASSSGTDGRSGDASAENVIWVGPDDGEFGEGTESNPFRDLQHALAVAEPGSVVRLQSGEYRANVNTTGGGDPGDPITLTGPPDAVVRAAEGGSTLLGIIHSHVHVTGLTFDGLADPERKWSDASAWASDIVVVSPGPRYEDEGVDYLEDVVFEPHAVGNAAGNLVQIERTRNASLGDFEVVGPAGASFHPEMDDPDEAHSSHVFYVGTSPPTIEEYKPWDSLDRTRDVRIHHVDNSAGYHHSTFASVRVGSENVTVEYCTDRNSGNETSGQNHVPAVDLGGNNCVVRGNDVGDCRYGISLGAWSPTEMADAADWARNNDVYTNRLQGVSRDAFAFHDTTPEAQRLLCDNRLVGVDADEYAYATGECEGADADAAGIGHTAGR
ncbi:right-handed parallel beta-helix repeat-containing protein [Halorussus halobius]|uniref:hypothetical protein n=1 Tax=Halorussus halobius TaxID=1710537 RepID=UPI00109206A7|nr:hypothetical protein [Halorussus halobius]